MFRIIFEKLFTSIAGSLWIFATLWDIYKLQRYWLDYTIEFYSSFFIFYLIIFSINPKSLPKKWYNSFKIITTVNGKDTMIIFISSLFLSDKHDFHKAWAIVLFLGGIIYDYVAKSESSPQDIRMSWKKLYYKLKTFYTFFKFF